MSWKNPQDWYNKRIAELEHSNEHLFGQFIKANEESERMFSRFKNEEKKCIEKGAELKGLQDRLKKLEIENRKLRKDVYAHKELQDALNITVDRIKELEKQLNLRSGREEPYGLSTPSSKKINKVNSSLENRAKRGGAITGHAGRGRKDFPEGEADKVIALNLKPDECECGSSDWQPNRIIPHSVYRFIPARVGSDSLSLEVRCCSAFGDIVVTIETCLAKNFGIAKCKCLLLTISRSSRKIRNFFNLYAYACTPSGLLPENTSCPQKSDIFIAVRLLMGLIP